MNALRRLVDYVVRMLQDPIDKSPSSVRHAAFLFVFAAIGCALIGVWRGHEAAQTVTALTGGGAFTFFSRTKATPGDGT